MRKNLLLLFIIISFGVMAQTFNQTNHAPLAGFNYSSLKCDTTNTPYLPGASGGGVTWDFHLLSILTTTNDFVTTVYNSAQFNPANFQVTTSSNDLYYQSKSDSLNLSGFSATINGVTIYFKYDRTKQAVLAKYPMNLTNNVSSITSGVTGAGAFTGNCYVEYDGSGTMMLPARTFTNVARLKTIQSYTFNIPLSYSGNVKTLTYDYYDLNASRVPILSVSTTTTNLNDVQTPSNNMVDSVQRFITIQKNHALVGINEHYKNAILLSVYPNPASTVVNFKTDSKDVSMIQITDVVGKMIDEQMFNSSMLSLNTQTYNAGVYFYTILDKNRSNLKTGKFIVQK